MSWKNRVSREMLLLLVFIFVFYAVLSQAKEFNSSIITIAKLGGTWVELLSLAGNQEATNVALTIDGGYIALIASGTYPSYNLYIIKLSSTGEIQWSKQRSSIFWPYAISQSQDGMYRIGFGIESFPWVETGLQAIWFNDSGSQIGAYYYTPPQGQCRHYNYFSEFSNDGYGILGGQRWYTSIPQYCYAFVVVISPTGTILLKGGVGLDLHDCSGVAPEWAARSAQRTNDSGVIAAGTCQSLFCVFKLTSTGSLAWAKEMPGTYFASSVIENNQGEYIALGCGISGTVIIKFSSDGSIIWQKAIAGGFYGNYAKIKLTPDNGYIIATTTAAYGTGGKDIWLIKLDADANIIWQKAYGGTGDEILKSIDLTPDGGYIIAAATTSFGANGKDALILKVDSNGNLPSNCNIVTVTSAAISSYGGTFTSLTNGVSIPLTANIYSGALSNSTWTSTLLCTDSLPPGAIPDGDNYPGTPLLIKKSGPSLLLTWSPPGGTCITSDYGIYRGTIPWNGYNHTALLCTTSNVAQATIDPDNDSYYYLIVAQSSGKEGSYGLDSANIQRPPAVTPCLPQELGSCN